MKVSHRLDVIVVATALAWSVPCARSQAQDDIFVYGRIKDLENKAPISDARVVMFSAAEGSDTVFANDTGYYECHLGYEHWTLVFEAPGFVSKRVIIDGRDVPEEQRSGGHGMNVEMTLFPPQPGRDFSILESPIGVARYNEVDSAIVWDVAYTDSIRDLVQRELSDTISSLAPDTEALDEAPPEREGSKALKYTLLFLLCAAAFTGLLLFLTRDRSS